MRKFLIFLIVLASFLPSELAGQDAQAEPQTKVAAPNEDMKRLDDFLFLAETYEKQAWLKKLAPKEQDLYALDFLSQINVRDVVIIEKENPLVMRNVFPETEFPSGWNPWDNLLWLHGIRYDATRAAARQIILAFATGSSTPDDGVAITTGETTGN